MLMTLVILVLRPRLTLIKMKMAFLLK
ncbi:UNVERIFIED_CONTAM: hypothetical protein GTU68_000783 [Idotea baltica]|nr:hypothetical protein [Idotea baltica]